MSTMTTDKPSETPRTDAESRSFEWWSDCWQPFIGPSQETEKKQTHFVKADFARSLEAKLREVEAREVELLGLCNDSKMAIVSLVDERLKKYWEGKFDRALSKERPNAVLDELKRLREENGRLKEENAQLFHAKNFQDIIESHT